MTTGSAILVASFPPKFRGRVLGFSVSSVYLGLAFGPFVGGILTQYLGWRSIFYVATALGVISSVIAFIFLGNDEDLEVTGEKLDLKGSLFYMTGLVAMVYGSSKIPALLGWLLMAGGLVALIVFWLLENRSAMPVLDTGLFTKNRLFAYSNIAALINYSATYAIVFLLSLFLQK
jgi:MFS family permease